MDDAMTGSSQAAEIVTTVHPGDEGDVLEITINRPAVHNCVNGAAAALLLDAWRRFQDDDQLLVAVLHGAGDKSFCSGADLTALDSLASLGEATANSGELLKRGSGPMGGTRLVQTKPVITMAQGYAYAGGLELFCHGHIRIAEPQATFSVACRRWGVPLVDGGTVYLPRLLGWGNALPLIITGERISAGRAHDIGLVWELVPEGAGLARAMDVARQICQQPRDAMLADLSSAINGLNRPLEEALEIEAANMYPVMRSQSTARGLERFGRGERFWFR
jgi:enoyl-CoA hydratase/carnithine racemase